MLQQWDKDRSIREEMQQSTSGVHSGRVWRYCFVQALPQRLSPPFQQRTICVFRVLSMLRLELSKQLRDVYGGEWRIDLHLCYAVSFCGTIRQMLYRGLSR